MDRTVSVFGGLALAASLIACSGVGGGNAAPSNASTAVPASPSVHTAGRGTGLMTGSQLKVLLLGEQDMPSGFRLNPKWAADSGGTPYPPLSATPTAPSARQCDRLTGAPWLPAAGLSPTSFAANGYRDVYRNEIDQMVAVYPRAGLGESVMTNLAKLFTLCSSFTSSSSVGLVPPEAQCWTRARSVSPETARASNSDETSARSSRRLVPSRRIASRRPVIGASAAITCE